MESIAAVVVALGAYCIGSIPVAVLIGRRHGVDPRSVGDRNPGYWNMQGQLGVRAAMPVFIGDALKGAVAGGLGLGAAVAVDATPWIFGMLAVAAAMIGHAWPIFARFCGGRSILVFSGGMCVVVPLAALVAIALCALTAGLTHRFAYGARAGVFAFPVFAFTFAGWQVALAAFACMSIIGLRFALAAFATRTTAKR